MTLVKLGILSYEMMRTTRSYAILAIVIIAAIITPTPDAFTLGLLAVPMYVLYEICIWLSFFLEKKERAKEAEEEQERLARVLPAPGGAALIDESTEAETEKSDDGDHDDDEHHEDDFYDEHHFEDDHEDLDPDPEEEDRHAQAPPIDGREHDPDRPKLDTGDGDDSESKPPS